jgi:hypothetical protein|tara:strand:- start:7 stop:189 length:183 start_codon:yes stop_codon:yes gene_type:complete
VNCWDPFSAAIVCYVELHCDKILRFVSFAEMNYQKLKAIAQSAVAKWSLNPCKTQSALNA